MQIDVVHEPGCAAPPLTPARTRALLQRAARHLSAPGRSLHVLFASDARLRELNARFRGKHTTTDVLSFPARQPGEAPPSHLGDLALSCGACVRQGRAARHGAAREAEILLLHGLLHLMGYDHEVDDGEMEFLERALRADLLGRGRGRQ